MRTLFFIVAAFSLSHASAQSWQLSGMTTEVPRGNGIAEKIYLTVSDSSGSPVKGLKAANFAAWGELCNTNRDCDFRPMVILAIVEEASGFYVMTSQFGGMLANNSAHKILVQVSTTTYGPGNRKTTVQHGQILVR